MRNIYGWWQFDDHHQAMVRASDGALLRFVEFAEDLPHGAVNQWMKFELQLQGRAPFSLLVERRDRAMPFKRPLCWRADLVRSFAANGGAPKSFGEAGEIERLVIDALTCWPKDTVAGVRPGRVGVEGGWTNGGWTQSLFRMRSAVEIQHIPQVQFGRLPCDDPGQWSFFAGDPGKGPISEPLAALQQARGQRLMDGLAERAERRPCFTNGNRLIFPLVKEQYSTIRWVYIDEDIITDRLTMVDGRFNTLPTNWHFHDNGKVRLGTRWRRNGAPVDFHHELGSRKDARREDADGIREIVDLPPEWSVRIHDALCEAIPHWQESSFLIDSAAVDGASEEVLSLGTFDTISDDSWSIAGGVRKIHGFIQANSLVDGDFRAMFEDRQLAAANIELANGELVFDGIAGAMRDRNSTRSLSFARTTAGSSDARNGQQFVLIYEDASGQWRVPIERPVRVDYYRGREWLVDHNGGLAAFRAQNPGATPNEVWWRSANEFITDALISWPDHETTGPCPAWLRLLGGFVGDSWDARLGRVISGSIVFHPIPPVSDQPWPTRPSARWSLLATGQLVSDPPPFDQNDATCLDADGLPAHLGTGALWARDDRQAWLSHVGRIVTHGHGGGTTDYWDYCDEHARLRLWWRDRSGFNLAKLIAYSPLNAATGDEAAPAVHDPNRHRIPNHELWSRLRDAIEARVSPGQVVRYSGRFHAGQLAGSSVLTYIQDGRLRDYQVRPDR